MLSKSWAPEKRSSSLATLGQSFEANGGFQQNYSNKDLGGVVTVTYNRSIRTWNTTIASIISIIQKQILHLIITTTGIQQNVLWGALANFSLRINPNNKISFKNLINVNTSDYTTLRTGKDFESNSQVGENVKAYEYGFRNNTFFNTQLDGEHNIPSLKVKV